MKFKYLALCLGVAASANVYAVNPEISYQNLPMGTSYMDGYQDGCDSALLYDIWKLKKDYGRQRVDSVYSRAWDLGFVTCRYNVYKK